MFIHDEMNSTITIADSGIGTTQYGHRYVSTTVPDTNEALPTFFIKFMSDKMSSTIIEDSGTGMTQYGHRYVSTTVHDTKMYSTITIEGSGIGMTKHFDHASGVRSCALCTVPSCRARTLRRVKAKKKKEKKMTTNT